MKEYICYKCGHQFSQKSHLDAHLNKKFTCKKCNVNFTTQYAYINNEYIHINNYVKNKKDKICCERGHELIMVNGTQRKKYFRHKNSNDVGGEPMTKWHCEWQGNFPVTEIDFRKVNGQIKDRRADIHIEKHDIIIEIQHSNIKCEEVVCRHMDYALHNKQVYWIIDGNTEDIDLDELTDGYLIIFSECWKYKSFQDKNEFILLDIQDKIFKIPIKKISTNMIKVKEFKPKDDVVYKLYYIFLCYLYLKLFKKVYMIYRGSSDPYFKSVALGFLGATFVLFLDFFTYSIRWALLVAVGSCEPLF